MILTSYFLNAFTLAEPCPQTGKIWAMERTDQNTERKREVLEQGISQCRFTHWSKDLLMSGDRPIATTSQHSQSGGRYKPIVTVLT